MTAPHIVDPGRLLGQALSDASPDLMRHLLGTVINSLLSAEADAVCGAEYWMPSPERVNSRNGYRHRELDTRVGTIDVAVPKLRQGSYFPEWLMERRKRAEAALVSVVATCYLLGVSTRRMDKLVQSLGITSLSKSQVSRMATDLDEQVAAFRTPSQVHRLVTQEPERLSLPILAALCDIFTCTPSDLIEVTAAADRAAATGGGDSNVIDLAATIKPTRARLRPTP